MWGWRALHRLFFSFFRLAGHADCKMQTACHAAHIEETASHRITIMIPKLQATKERESKMFPFAVLHWGSHPDQGNDDCYSGSDYDTLSEAVAAFQKSAPFDIAYIEIDGATEEQLSALGIQSSLRQNPDYSAKACKFEDDLARQERTMQAGMMGGCQAYNDALEEYDNETPWGETGSAF